MWPVLAMIMDSHPAGGGVGAVHAAASMAYDRVPAHKMKSGAGHVRPRRLLRTESAPGAVRSADRGLSTPYGKV
jgi:hypothetical protein